MTSAATRARLRPAQALRDVAARWRNGRSPRELWLLAAILAIAAALRIVWVLYAARSPQGFHDPTFYFLYAGQIANGHGYGPPDGSPTAYYPIGYPAALAAVFALVKHTPMPDSSPYAAGFFQTFLGLATVWLVYEVARRLFDARAGLLAGLWIAVFPNLIYHTAAYLSETLFNAVIVAALAVVLCADWRARRLGWARLALLGVLLGFATLVRPIALLLLPLLPVAWVVAGFGWQRTLTYTGGVVIAIVAVIIPWTIRNIIVMDAPVIISTNLGDDLCMGHYLGATGHFALPDACFSDAPYVGLGRADFEVQRNNDNIRRAITFAVHHPGTELKLLSRKSYYTWDQDHDGLWAVESYHDDPFIGSRFSLQIVPGEVPAAQIDQVASALATITGLPLAGVNAAIASDDPSAPVTLAKDLDIKIANHIRDAKLPGVHLVIPRSLLRQALERTADIFFFTTISLGGLGLAGFVWRPLEPRRLYFLLALLALAGSPLPFFGDARFHVPALPLLAVAAAWAVLAAPSLKRLLVAPRSGQPP